jgi:hypothetical protein
MNILLPTVVVKRELTRYGPRCERGAITLNVQITSDMVVEGFMFVIDGFLLRTSLLIWGNVLAGSSWIESITMAITPLKTADGQRLRSRREISGVAD